MPIGLHSHPRSSFRPRTFPTRVLLSIQAVRVIYKTYLSEFEAPFCRCPDWIWRAQRLERTAVNREDGSSNLSLGVTQTFLLRKSRCFLFGDGCSESTLRIISDINKKLHKFSCDFLVQSDESQASNGSQWKVIAKSEQSWETEKSFIHTLH